MPPDSYEFWLLDKGVERWLDYAFPNYCRGSSVGLRVRRRQSKTETENILWQSQQLKLDAAC